MTIIMEIEAIPTSVRLDLNTECLGDIAKGSQWQIAKKYLQY